MAAGIAEVAVAVAVATASAEVAVVAAIAIANAVACADPFDSNWHNCIDVRLHVEVGEWPVASGEKIVVGQIGGITMPITIKGIRINKMEIKLEVENGEYTATGDYARIALGISVMCVYVLVFNRILWRPLYAYAEKRFRLD